MESFIGQEVDVLLEGEYEQMPNYLEGLDDHYLRICAEAPERMKKTMQKVRITERRGEVLIGELV